MQLFAPLHQLPFAVVYLLLHYCYYSYTVLVAVVGWGYDFGVAGFVDAVVD